MRAVGVDVGATRLHVAVLDDRIETWTTSSIDDVVRACDGADAVAVDAPSDPATGRTHVGARSPKFAVARCNEIAAGEELGVWVPWVTPRLGDCPMWMQTGFALWQSLRAAGHEPMEVYPAGCFWLLNGRRWPPRKQTAQGRSARLALLGLDVCPTSHDHVDALMAAVVARGPSRRVGHDGPGCDGSTMWVLA